MSSHYSIVVNEQTAERLDRMLATGLWGDDRAGVVEQLVMAGVRDAIGTGLIDLYPPEPEEEESEDVASEPRVIAPRPPPADGNPVCDECLDGNDIQDFDCKACGRMTF